MNLPPLPNDLERILHGYQRQPARQIFRALTHGLHEWDYPGGVDLSDVGTGKSYMDAAAALATGRRPVVLCPVVGVEGWKSVFKAFGTEAHHVGSYEAVRGGWRKEIGDFKDGKFVWRNTSNIVLILDECHIIKGQESMTAATMGGAINAAVPIIAASATMATSPVDMRIAGRIAGLHKGGADWKRFLQEKKAEYDPDEERWKWDRRKNLYMLDEIHRILIPQRGARVRKADMGEQPGTTIQVLPFDVPEKAEIEKAWRELDEKTRWMERERMPKEQVRNFRRAGRTRIWKRSEMALVPLVCERAKQCLAEGKSVVLFFSFTASRLLAGKIMKTKDGFFGGQNQKQRERIKAEFQANRIHVLLCNIGAAGASVSLHDTTGERPRETFIFPTDNPVKMGQAPGRVDRNGGKTHSLQWIPCIGGGFSQRMVESTARKLTALSVLNDGDGQNRLP